MSSVKPKILGWILIVSVNDVRSPSNHWVEYDAATAPLLAPLNSISSGDRDNFDDFLH